MNASARRRPGAARATRVLVLTLLGLGRLAMAGADDETAPCPPTKIVFERPLTLATAIDQALCRNARVRRTWALIKVQRAQLGEAQAAYLPTIRLGLSRVRAHTDYSDPRLADVHDARSSRFASLTWRLLDFGGRDANRNSAMALLDAATASHDLALQQLMQEVVTAYFEVLTAQAQVEARRAAQALAAQTLETAERREAHGAGAHAETLQATTAWARAALDDSRARGASDKAESTLLHLVGVPPAATRRPIVAAPDDLQDTPALMERTLAEWLALAEQRHPAIMAARAQIKSSRERLVAVGSEGLPTLDLAQNVYVNGRPDQGVATTRSREMNLGLTLSIPLFDGFSRTHQVRGAQARIEAGEAELDDTRGATLTEVVRAHADAVAAGRNLAAARRLEDAAQAALDSVQRRFEHGVVDVRDSLSAQTAWIDARQERIRALADWRASRLRLVASAGVLEHGGYADPPRELTPGASSPARP